MLLLLFRDYSLLLLRRSRLVDDPLNRERRIVFGEVEIIEGVLGDEGSHDV